MIVKSERNKVKIFHLNSEISNLYTACQNVIAIENDIWPTMICHTKLFSNGVWECIIFRESGRNFESPKKVKPNASSLVNLLP